MVTHESSHPVINKTVKAVMALKTDHEKLKCRIDALIKYNKALIAASKKLDADLKKCR